MSLEELDGPNADKIRDAWVIALERYIFIYLIYFNKNLLKNNFNEIIFFRGARERLQKLPALKKVKPRDIQAILHQQVR